eukprot:6389611-Amphidinium_carterae.1
MKRFKGGVRDVQRKKVTFSELQPNFVGGFHAGTHLRLGSLNVGTLQGKLALLMTLGFDLLLLQEVLTPMDKRPSLSAQARSKGYQILWGKDTPKTHTAVGARLDRRFGGVACLVRDCFKAQAVPDYDHALAHWVDMARFQGVRLRVDGAWFTAFNVYAPARSHFGSSLPRPA